MFGLCLGEKCCEKKLSQDKWSADIIGIEKRLELRWVTGCQSNEYASTAAR